VIGVINMGTTLLAGLPERPVLAALAFMLIFGLRHTLNIHSECPTLLVLFMLEGLFEAVIFALAGLMAD